VDISAAGQTAFQKWMADLETRYFAELTFPEISRALRALSSTYVERRSRIAEGAALAGAGKRAAFALFYGPLHFLLVREIMNELAAGDASAAVVDLGCGTGAAGAAFALALGAGTRIVGFDRNGWAAGEATRTYQTFGLSGRARQGDVATAALPRDRSAFVAAFTMNELAAPVRDRLMGGLVERVRSSGEHLLVVEPLARAVAPWWGRWAGAVAVAGGRADEWRFRVELPAVVAKLDRAAGLDHRELIARTLWI
jgi:SAM-dependent methyltransferase